MSPGRLPSWALRRRLALIVGAVMVMAGGVLLMDATRVALSDTRPAGTLAPDAPIPAEADVFRLSTGDLAAGAAEPRAGARRRTLPAFRSLRAYPGAPPRIPHALAADEFRGTTCNACHERGGFTARFGAYAPVTPHPEYRNCLQCHAVDDGIVGVPHDGRADAGTRRTSAADFVATDWRTTAWPAIAQRAMPGSPPAIPHTLDLRGNCIACHAGPAAVAEIRTTHPERANCRQCHVPTASDPHEDAFRRPVRAAAAGGAP